MQSLGTVLAWPHAAYFHIRWHLPKHPITHLPTAHMPTTAKRKRKHEHSTDTFARPCVGAMRGPLG